MSRPRLQDPPLPVPINRPADEPPVNEPDLLSYAQALWRHKLLVVAGTLLCGVAALVANWSTPRVYEAFVTMTVEQPGAPDSAAAASSMATFRAMLENRAVADGVVRELGLDRSPFSLSGSSFVNSVLQVEEIPNSSLLIARVRLAEATVAARAVNRLAGRAAEYAERMGREAEAASRDAVKAELDRSLARLHEVEIRLAAFRQTSQLEVARKEVGVLVNQREDLLRLQVSIEALRARLAEAERQLAGHRRTFNVKRSIGVDPALLEAARRAGRAGDSLLDLQLQDEVVDPVYQKLAEEVASSRTGLSALEREREELSKLVDPRSGRLPRLTALYAQEAAFAKLTAEHDLASRFYNDLSARHEQLRLPASRTARLRVIDPAVVPQGPVGPPSRLNVVMGLLLGLVLSVVGVLIVHRVRETW